MTPIRVFLADDHSVLRAGLIALLTAEPDIEVVGEASDGYECVEKAIVLEPDVILMDVNMPRCGGLEALGKVRADLPGTKVLVLTMHDDVGYLRRVLASGGSGYVLKQAASLRVRLVSADTGDTNDALDHGELFLIFPSGKRQGPFPVGSAGVIINRLAPGRYRLLGSVDGFVQHVAVSADLLGGEQTESEIPLHKASSASN
jgi:CheY-like chemotaxis protein